MNATLNAELPHPAATQRRVLIVDDHAVVRKGLAAMLGEEDDLMVCGEAESAPQALEAMRRFDPDVAVLDISMPGSNGIELTKAMLAERPKLPILIFSVHDESLYALRALRAGAKGYVMKSESVLEIMAALRKVLGGEIYVSPRFGERLVFQAIQSQNGSVPASPVDILSDRELEVLHHLGKGEGTRDIAANLNLSVKTIETHRAHIKEKLGVKDSEEMVRFALDWVTLEEG
ncbi:MAG: response regulator transcription factor [Chthoniobacter sp.]|nr:response regulator transcription factor [Chthoniobacter sp.]